MMIDLGVGGSNGAGVALNESDQVVGSVLRQSGTQSAIHAFFWEDGVTTDFGTLPGGTDSAASGVNESRFVVGWSATKGKDIPHAVMWKRNGFIRDLGTLGGQTSHAYAINGRRQIVGGADTPSGDLHAFLWQNGVMMDLGTLGGSSSVAFGINACGQVVGQSQTASGKSHAFVWENGVMTDIGKLYGDDESGAFSINESRQIVGYGQAAPSVFHAVLWTPK